MSRIYNLDADYLFSHDPTKYDLQIHDIPYNVSHSDIVFTDGRKVTKDFGEWDHTEIDLQKLAYNCSQVGKPDSSVIVWFNNYWRISELVRSLGEYYDKVSIIVWNKTNPKPQIRKRTFTSNYELGVVAMRGNYTFNFPSHTESFMCYQMCDEEDYCPWLDDSIIERIISSVYSSGLASGPDRRKDEAGNILHPTQKPVRLLQHYINILTNPGDLVLDAYAGVGTTAVACIRSGRFFTINDIDKSYVDEAVKWISEIYGEDISLSDFPELV